jgi:3-oxoacyl-[acyl-carrier protein] reductase
MRNVIVTGGTRGLGLAIGCALHEAGYRVIAIARNVSTEFAVVEQNDFVLHLHDLSQIDSLRSLVDYIRREYGPIYALVNNAGIGTSGLLATMSETDIQRLIALNVTSPIVMAKYAVRSMMAHGEGRIVNVSSIVASTGYAGLSVYSATKASLIGFTHSIAREVGSLGITVNAIAPGFVATDMTQDLTTEKRDQIARRSALRRLAEASDIAHAVEYLMSDRARNITGTVLTIDAGNTA